MKNYEQNNPAWANDSSDIIKMLYWRERCFIAEKLLNNFLDQKEIGRACHIDALETKVERLKEEIRYQQGVAEYRNRQLNAANLITLCTGGCPGGIMGDGNKIDEQTVCDVEMIAKRMRSWFVNHLYKEKNYKQK